MSRDKGSLKHEFVSGFVAGSLTSMIVHPFDLVKLRLQLNAARGTTTWWTTVKSILDSNAGNVTSRVSQLYRGVSINVMGNSIAWALYFGLYRAFKDKLIHAGDDAPNPLLYLASGTLAGISTSVLTNPIWILKTRIMSQNKVGGDAKYSTLTSSLHNAIKQHRWQLFKIGITPAILGVSQGALYFMIYDTLKNHYIMKDTNINNLFSTSQVVSTSSVAKMISMSLIYPLQLLKSNQQSIEASSTKEYQSMRKLVPFIIKQNGIQGLYKGLLTNLFKSVPSTCITFYIYETVNNL
ncbi:mitochondrial nicotinamide adenine dinucleotide transporter 2 [Monosporozyma servazzii]